MKKIEIDLHGVKHSEVEATLANAFFWENIKEAEVITGNSIKMKKIVRDWFKENKLTYIEYFHTASFLVQQ
jgi:DNA-nicking Smr family endonuclease